MDYNDIAKNAEFIGDLFRGIEGYRVDWVGTKRGIVAAQKSITRVAMHEEPRDARQRVGYHV